MERKKLGFIRMSLKAYEREYRKRKEAICTEEEQTLNSYKNPRFLTQNEAIQLFGLDFTTFKRHVEDLPVAVACVYRPGLRREHFIYPVDSLSEHAEMIHKPWYHKEMWHTNDAS